MVIDLILRLSVQFQISQLIIMVRRRYNQQPHSMAPEVLSHHHSYYHLAFFQEDRLDSDRRLLHLLLPFPLLYIQWHRQVRLFTVYVKQQSSII